jgi:hypothetical protein
MRGPALYLSAVYGIFSLAVGLSQSDDRILLIGGGVVALALVPFWYWTAVASTGEWRACVKALVNIGRQPLAAALSIRLPATLAQEQLMWACVSRLAQGTGDQDDVRILMGSAR